MLVRLIIVLTFFTIVQLNVNAQENCYQNSHSTMQDDVWLSCTASSNPNTIRGNSHWILYDLGFNYTITSTHFWNYNVGGQLGFGMKDIYVDYSLDGNNWTNAATFQLAQATGTSNYFGEIGPDLGGVNARYVLITAANNWGGSCTGLSEVRFNLGQQCATAAEIIGLPATVSNLSPVNLSASPPGGTFSGPGIIFNAFNPSLSGPGLHTIEYTYTDGDNCTSSTAETILVFTIDFTFVNYNLGTISPKITDELILDIEVPLQDRYTIQLTDALGRPVYFNEINYLPGLHRQQIMIQEAIARGFYFLTITNSYGSVSQKLVHTN